MIPKKIHYCWFGRGNKPELAKRCIESWHKFLPDYEIKEWNEDNFDLDLYPYAREAYDQRKFAFVTDVVRLFALYTEGGIYMDTDVEVIRPLDALLNYKAVSGFESDTQIPTGLIASQAGLPILKELLADYIGLHFIKADGTLDLTTNVVRITKIFNMYGFVPNNQQQTIKDFTLLPKDFLCPKDFVSKKVHITSNTLCIHHFDGSWISSHDKCVIKLKKYLPKQLFMFLVRIKKCLKKILNKLLK